MEARIAEDLLGKVLSGTYRLDRIIGLGGMGAVFQAKQLHKDQAVAVKVLLPNLGEHKDALARFRREAETVCSLGHPGIVAIHDFSQTAEGLAYIVMDFLDGEDLDARLRRRRGAGLEWSEAFDIVEQVSDALAVAHAHGIVHRDLKPANIFLIKSNDNEERVVILDFGLAKVMNPAPAMTQLTKTGIVMGTPQYMSPEQAEGGEIDHHTDIFALGAVFYEMLCNEPPFAAPNLPALFYRLISEEPVPLSKKLTNKFVPAGIDEVIKKALAKEKKDRFSSMNEFREALLAIESDISRDTEYESVPLDTIRDEFTLMKQLALAGMGEPTQHQLGEDRADSAQAVRKPAQQNAPSDVKLAATILSPPPPQIEGAISTERPVVPGAPSPPIWQHSPSVSASFGSHTGNREQMIGRAYSVDPMSTPWALPAISDQRRPPPTKWGRWIILGLVLFITIVLFCVITIAVAIHLLRTVRYRHAMADPPATLVMTSSVREKSGRESDRNGSHLSRVLN